MYIVNIELRNELIFTHWFDERKVTFKIDYVFLKGIKKMHCFQGEQDNA